MKSPADNFATLARLLALRCPGWPSGVCIRIYESHGDDVPNAHTHALGRLTCALQNEGSVDLDKPTQQCERRLQRGDSVMTYATGLCASVDRVPRRVL